MGIQNIYILQENGLLIYSKDYHSLKEDPIIVSGFLTAINSFAQSIGAGNEIKSIETEKYKFVGDISPKYKIKFIIICDKKDDALQAEHLVKTIRRSFISKFNKLLRKKDDPFENLNEFKCWETNLDVIINNSNLSSLTSVLGSTMKDLKKIFKKIKDDDIKN